MNLRALAALRLCVKTLSRQHCHNGGERVSLMSLVFRADWSRAGYLPRNCYGVTERSGIDVINFTHLRQGELLRPR
jgi:hypothetical protein